MQFMLDISRSMSKAYKDLVSNFLSTLTNLVLLRRDAYLHHAHPNLDAFRVRNLRAAPVSGGDLFERSLMQEYEQHLIGLGVKPGSKKEQCFHPYKQSKRVGVDVNKLHKGLLPTHAGSTIYGAATLLSTSTPRWSQRGTWWSKSNAMLLGDLLHCVFPVTPPEGEKTLSVLSLPEREKTLCVQPPPEGGKTPRVQSPPEGEKILVVQSQDTSKLVQFKSVFIPEKDLPVGGRLRQFLPEWDKHGSHRLITGLIRDRYKLPFRERPNLSRVPCIISSYAGFDKQSALWTSLQDLLQKGAVEVVHTSVLKIPFLVGPGRY